MHDPPTHEDASDDRDSTKIDRRRLLKLTGAGAVATSLAGCVEDAFEEVFGDVEARSEEATPAGLSRQGMVDLAYPDVSTRTFQRAAAGTDEQANKRIVYDLTDEQFTYGTQQGVDFPAFVYTTRTARVAGEDQNAYQDRNKVELVEDGPFDLEFLQSVGLLRSHYDTWETTPSSTISGAASLLGKGLTTNVITVSGVARPSNTNNNPNLRTVWVGLMEVYESRSGTNDDVVYAGVATAKQGRHSSEPERLFDLMRVVARSVTQQPPTSAPNVASPSFSDSRLVQTVANTRVEDGTHVLHTVDEPDLVADENAATVFDLDVAPGDLPQWAYVDEAVGNRFALARNSLGELASVASEPPAVFDRDARQGTALNLSQDIAVNPTPFKMSINVPQSVSLRMEAPCGYEYDSTTLRMGRDYSVQRARHLRVGFIDVRDPDGGSNYGNAGGQAQQGYRSVQLAVTYLQLTYPGGVLAYYHRPGFRGARKGVFGRGEYRDHKWAQKILEKKRSNGNLSGQFYAPGAGDTQADAEVKIKKRGFDVWVLIVPDGYYSHHGKDVTGLYPGSNQKAVSVLDRSGMRNDRVVGEVAAQEIGHFYAEEPYEHSGRSYPMAQRDEKGSEGSYGGLSLDFDHARHRDSTNFGSGGPTDRPALVSEGYDFTDGTFRLVEDFSIDPGSFTPDTNNPDTNSDPVESFMSYSNDRLWADAWMHQKLIDTSYGTAKNRGQGIFSGVARTDEDGAVRFDSVDAFRGGAVTEDTDEGAVLMEFVTPDGETVLSRRVQPSFEVDTHDGTETVPLMFVQFPFPETAAVLRTEHADVRTRVNPIVRPIRDAVERIPDRGFVRDPGETRARLHDQLDGVAALMRDRAYGGANDQLSEFDAFVAEAVREDYEALANQPLRSDLLLLTERMHERLAALADY